MSERWKHRPGRVVTVGALVALWIIALVLALAGQTTSLLGVRGGAVAWLLSGVAALSFIAIGCMAVWLTLSGLDEHDTSAEEPPAEGGEA